MSKRRPAINDGPRRPSGMDPGADAELAKMGYTSELPRNLSMLSVLGM